MFSQIVNPKTGRKVSINSRLGKRILSNYVNQLGGHNGPCAINPSSGRCKKSKVGDSNCEVVNGRCKKINKTVKKSTKKAKKSVIKKTKPVKKATKPVKKEQHSETKIAAENVEQVDREGDIAYVFTMDIELTPTPGSNYPPSEPSIFAVNPGQDPRSKAWDGNNCYEPHWDDNGEPVPDDAECPGGRFTWMKKQGILSSGQAHCNGRIINCTDEEVINQRHRKWYKIREEEHRKHFNMQVADELKRMIRQGAKEGDLVENLSESSYRTSGVYILQKDSTGKLCMTTLDIQMDDYGHIGKGFSLGPEYPVGYWNRAKFNKAYWHGDPTIEPVHKDIVLNLKASDLEQEEEQEGIFSVAYFEWGALKFPGTPSEVLKKIPLIEFVNDRVYFEEHQIGIAEIIDGQWANWALNH